MSWQAYVDEQLVKTKAVNQGAIIGHDGNTWATSPGFTVSPADGKALVGLFSNPTDASAKGINAGGNKYITVKADNRSIYGKKGPGGIVTVKTGKAVVIAVYGEGQQPGNAANVVEKLADYLIENGY
eukprot:TRINITY_DN2416_c0_g1_i1.p1 TRINITY_DN2416_c0_g1~~TRINITY_DN2416_c0_g1_i1.p1  ORF type:complete len:145 (-),score=50.52 TRINITY_DN2416_c0_g1_i1:37-417(-)